MGFKTFNFLIVPNYFAPKYQVENKCRKIHAISYSTCNFRCNYCDFKYRKKKTTYNSYNILTFAIKVLMLRFKGSCYKFTGGEPTLNPQLNNCLKIVKFFQGKVYLDTNASRPAIVEALLEQSLIDVLAISLKALSGEKATEVTGVAQKWCWDFVLKTLEVASHYPNVPVIVTHVCNQNFTYELLCTFAEIIQPFKNVYLKLNNYQYQNQLEGNGWLPMDNNNLDALLLLFLNEHPQWNDRVILVDNHDAVEHFEKIKFY